MLKRYLYLIKLKIISFLAFSFFLPHLYAAEVTTALAKDGIYFFLQGDIEKGDYESLVGEINIVALLSYDRRPLKLYLNSMGGDLEEAMQIGRLVNVAGISTFADNSITSTKDGKCLSACFFIFVAGKQRFLESESTLGIHRPYFDRKNFGSLTAEEAESAYKSIKLDVKKYLLEMSLSQNIVDYVLSIPSDKIKYFTITDFNSKIGKNPPHFEEWLISKCTSYPDLTKEEKHDFSMIQTADLFKKIYSEERFLEMAKSPELANTIGKYIGFSSGYISYIKAKSVQRSNCFQDAVIEVQARFIDDWNELREKRLKDKKN